MEFQNTEKILQTLRENQTGLREAVTEGVTKDWGQGALEIPKAALETEKQQSKVLKFLKENYFPTRMLHPMSQSDMRCGQTCKFSEV